MFFTCARPGRSKSATDPVADPLVQAWARGLPGGSNTVLVSLLGRKHGPDGVSEFSFYSFHGAMDHPLERRGRPSFQEWLREHTDRDIQVIEHPTYDFRPIPAETLSAVGADVIEQLSAGRTVVLIDSGGETRTKVVCKYLGFTEDTIVRSRTKT